MSGPLSSIEDLRHDIEAQGLRFRGWVVFAEGEAAPAIGDGRDVRAVLLIGPIGGSLWDPFSAWQAKQPDSGGADPLDQWSTSVIGGLAARAGLCAFFPFAMPYQPFQQWARRAEGLQASPLGLLIHPVYGLWHSYRGALGFTEADALRFGLDLMALPKPAALASQPSPCADCIDKPCLSGCPVNAVDSDRFDVAACRKHLAGLGEGTGCMGGGCEARNACPVGAAYRPSAAQLRFHMEALWLPR